MAMKLNFDRGYGQTPEQMIQSLMESTQMALDTMERNLADVGVNIGQGGNNNLLDMFFPVGSYYTTGDASFNPNTAWGGRWERIKDRFVWAAGDDDTIGTIGGSKDAIVVSHSHTPSASGELFVTSEEGEANNTRVTYSASGNRWVDGQTAQSHFHHRYNTNVVGQSGEGANMPPYITAYVWERIE